MDLQSDPTYDEVFARHWHAVFGSALAWTNEVGAAEDLAQEAFLRLWANRHAIDWNGPVLGWLLVTVRRLATDRFRRLRVRSFAHRTQRMPSEWDEDIWAEWLDVRQAMFQLTPKERVALTLTAVEGLTSAEVGQVLNVTASAVRATVSRAREKLAASQVHVGLGASDE